MNVLVVGGGSVAARKVNLLRAAGALVRVVALEFCPEIQAAEAKQLLADNLKQRNDVKRMNELMKAQEDVSVACAVEFLSSNSHTDVCRRRKTRSVACSPPPRPR